MAWAGAEANETERRGVMELCGELLVASHRSRDTPVLVVKAGQEPSNFTCHFLGWDHQKAKVCSSPSGLGFRV